LDIHCLGVTKEAFVSGLNRNAETLVAEDDEANLDVLARLLAVEG
jgi:hypothetical protein